MRRDWLPPTGPRTSLWWVLVSVAAHVVFIALVVITTNRTFPSEPAIVILLPGGPETSGAAELPWETLGEATEAGGQEGGRAGTVGERGSGAEAAPAAPTPVAAPETVPTGVPPARRVAEEPGEGPPRGVEEGRVPPGEGRRRGGLLGARLGDGRLWVRPWDAIAAAIAGAGRDSLDAPTHAALIDSVVSARIAAFLDTLPVDSFAVRGPPSWVTEIDGQKWGLDGSWIYLGGIKLPSAILALLPLPQGNYDEAKHATDLARVREDIMQAARRAEDAESFRKYVNETRARRDAERQARKNQKVAPDSIKT